MTIKQALINGNNLLKKLSKEASLEAELLLCHVLQTDRPSLTVNDLNELTDQQYAEYAKLLALRQQHEPLAYITNHKEFCGLDFYVDNRVLIPRPETEQLVEQIIAYTKAHQAPATGWSIADIGTGSGAIAISLAKSIAHCAVYATDISGGALAVAQQNAARHAVSNKIKFLHASLLESTPPVDIIAANLPYIPANDISSLELEVQQEPNIALDGGSDGLALYRQLFVQIAAQSEQPQIIICEIEYRHAKLAQQVIATLLPEATIAIRKDFQGLDRFAVVNLEKHAR